MSSALVGQIISELGKQQYINSCLGGNTRGPSFGGVVCYYYHKPRHVIRDSKKLQNQNKRFLRSHIAYTNEASDQSLQFSAKELAKFHLYQESLKSPSTLITAIAESGNLNTCLVSSSSYEWVIDSGVTYHMTSNSSLFATFQSQPSTSTVTLAYGSHSSVLGSSTIFPTPYSSVIRLALTKFLF